MFRYPLLKGFSFIVLSFFLVSCGTTTLPPIGSSSKPFQIEGDEKELWKDADRFERKLEKSTFLHKDAELETYLNALLLRLLPPGFETQTIQPHVRVIKSPFLNAFALPNGAIYIQTGLLVRMENEAQLATILAHEMVHFLNRHILREMRNTENKKAFLQGMQFFLISTGYGAIVALALSNQSELWTLASIRGYSRELEAEADEEGLKALARAGYDPEQAPKAFEHLMEEIHEGKIKETFSFSTHPRLQERIGNYRAFIREPRFQVSIEVKVVTRPEEFEKRIQELLLDNAAMDMDLGRFTLAQGAIERRLKQNPQDPRAYFLMGEFHRRSGKGGYQDLQKAIDAYRQAIRLNPLYAEPHRELGFLYRVQNLKEKSRAEFEEYLSLNPKAIDAPIIKDYLGNP